MLNDHDLVQAWEILTRLLSPNLLVAFILFGQANLIPCFPSAPAYAKILPPLLSLLCFSMTHPHIHT